MKLTRDAGEIINSEQVIKAKGLITIRKRNSRITQVESKLTEICEVRVQPLMGDHNAITVHLPTL